MSIPFPDLLLDRARGIAETLPARIARANEHRDLDPDVIAAIEDADLFRLFRPRRFGGFEMAPGHFYDIQNVFAERCLSTAWVYGVLSIQSFVLALFDARAQDDVWGTDPTARVSSSFKPEGTVEPVDGGYRITGRWTFSSGSRHAGWALVGGLVPQAGAPPQMRLFLVPRADYEIVDTWHTFGLRGTGSNDLRIEGAFVPTHRSWQPTPGVTLSTARDIAPLYRLPWLFMFPSCIANLAIGAGRGAVKRLAQSCANAPAAAAEQVRLAIGRASRRIEAANLLLQANVATMYAKAQRGEALAASDAILYRSQLAAMLREIAAEVDTLMLHTGGRGISETGPLTQTWLDLCAARHHMGNIPDGTTLGLADALIEVA
ncbi:MAG: flavin-dependent monooxygenase [Sphingomonadaceae bacterium]|nr:flavin-dependent monooxygenase [Sphingomonadaceae bacterium]